jgi:hypothetical protein
MKFNNEGIQVSTFQILNQLNVPSSRSCRVSNIKRHLAAAGQSLASAGINQLLWQKHPK